MALVFATRFRASGDSPRYRIALRINPSRIFFVCRYCHQRKVIDAGGGDLYETTTSTSTSARHLEQRQRGHGHLAPSKARLTKVVDGSLCAILKNGKIEVTQAVANELLGFHCQDFCVAAVSWLVKNNHPLHEFKTLAFRALLEAANLEAARTLWTHHTSMSRFVMRLYESIPAYSCECERMFGKLGDLLEPQRRAISPQLLAAIQCVQRWLNAGFGKGHKPTQHTTDNELDLIDQLGKWDRDSDSK
jgi:hypothetical protein